MVVKRTIRLDIQSRPSTRAFFCISGFNNKGKSMHTPAHANAACGSALTVEDMKSLANSIALTIRSTCVFSSTLRSPSWNFHLASSTALTFFRTNANIFLPLVDISVPSAAAGTLGSSLSSDNRIFS